jgi:hypothetical protein
LWRHWRTQVVACVLCVLFARRASSSASSAPGCRCNWVRVHVAQVTARPRRSCWPSRSRVSRTRSM